MFSSKFENLKMIIKYETRALKTDKTLRFGGGGGNFTLMETLNL